MATEDLGGELPKLRLLLIIYVGVGQLPRQAAEERLEMVRKSWAPIKDRLPADVTTMCFPVRSNDDLKISAINLADEELMQTSDLLVHLGINDHLAESPVGPVLPVSVIPQGPLAVRLARWGGQFGEALEVAWGSVCLGLKIFLRRC